MDRSANRAGIEVHGRVMRYAEIGGRGSDADPFRLVRLGACDFDFDIAEALFSLSGSAHLDTIATALREIFADAVASTFTVAVHPWNATSFFSPLPSGMSPAERFEQLRQEAAMLSDASVTRPVRVKATPIRIEALGDGREAHWHHVLRLSDTIHARFAHVTTGDAEQSHDFVDTTGGAAAVAGRQVPEEEDEDPAFALALGVYDGRFEVALCRGEAWHFGHHVDAGALENGAYYVGALLDRLGVDREDVAHLFFYGDDADLADAEGVEDFLDLDAVPLNPLEVFGPTRSGTDPLILSAYAPVIGALLH